jgi:hypothetical protein
MIHFPNPAQTKLPGRMPNEHIVHAVGRHPAGVPARGWNEGRGK